MALATMPAFNPSHSLSPLEFDFSSVDGPSGVIPEPSAEMCEAYLAAAVRVNRIEQESGDARLVRRAVLDAVAALCQGTPSKVDLEALPHRVFMGFTKWLSFELGSPALRAAALPARRCPWVRRPARRRGDGR